MICQDEINQQLSLLQGIIMERIHNIRELINDEDRWVAE